jgi:type I restriction enzyme R subunit
MNEQQIEQSFIAKLTELKYEYRPEITDRAALEKNFREKFEALSCIRLTHAEFARLLYGIITPDVFTASKTLRSMNSFTCDDGTPLNFTLVNIRDWSKNHFEVINQLRINTDNSHHPYDVILLINGVHCVQIELKTLGVNPSCAMEQIVEYKNDAGYSYTKTLLCLITYGSLTLELVFENTTGNFDRSSHQVLGAVESVFVPLTMDPTTQTILL